ncbi:hypothetical protein BC832DRAFT_57246 [Gaertneriomyces semiglobifer]|nr:hypothetical protein BC832DRAFT_57246 [Gaertneriomyces semiglobifer]
MRQEILHAQAARTHLPGVDVPRVWKSTVVQYTLDWKETCNTYPTCPHPARASHCFRILEDVIPRIGPVGDFIKTLVEELRECVYVPRDREVTSNELAGRKWSEPVERVPWFVEMMRRKKEAEETTANQSEMVTSLQQKLKFREYDLQLLEKKNLALKEALRAQEAAAQKLQETVSSMQNTTEELKQEIELIKEESKENEQDLRNEIEELHTNLTQSNHVIEKLSVFKEGYEARQEEEIASEEEAVLSSMPLHVTSSALRSYSHYQVTLLHSQLSEILNVQLDDYETSLSQLRKKRDILKGAGVGGGNEEGYEAELEVLKGEFERRIGGLLEERELLDVRIKALTEKLGEEEEDRIEIQRSGASFSMHTSTDNAETFKPYKEMSFCAKCGERTVICPHRALPPHFLLPPSTTHIKFTNPPLLLRFSRVERPLTPFDDYNEAELETTPALIKQLWQWFYDKYQEPLMKGVPVRVLTLQKVLAFVEEAMEYAWEVETEIDKRVQQGEVFPLFIDIFTDMMTQRYPTPLSTKPMHDLFTSLQNNLSNPYVTLFVRCLIGEEDCLWKYMLLVRKLLTAWGVTNKDGWRRVVGVLWPSRTKEMYEQIELEYVAFSKNRFTPQLVEEHVLHMIKTGREPNQIFFTRALKHYDYSNTSLLAYRDFDEALSRILPGAPIRAKRLRFDLTSRTLQFLQRGDPSPTTTPTPATTTVTAATASSSSTTTANDPSLPIARLALVACYISLHAAYMNGWTPQAVLGKEFMEDDILGLATANRAEVEEGQKEVDAVLRDKVVVTVEEEKVVEEVERMRRRVKILSRVSRADYDGSLTQASEASTPMASKESLNMDRTV